MTQFRIALPDDTVLEGELVTVALAFLMHEYASVAMDTEAQLRGLAVAHLMAAEAEQALEGDGDDPALPDELENPERYAHLVPGATRAPSDEGDDDGAGVQGQ